MDKRKLPPPTLTDTQRRKQTALRFGGLIV